jgi:hypothetical protein
MASEEIMSGKRLPGFRERLALIEQMDGKAVADNLKQSFESALLIVPQSVTVLDPRFTPLPEWSTTKIEGKEYQLKLPKDDRRARLNRLVVGDKGVTRTVGQGQVVTIPFSELGAAMTWNDGSWTLIGNDGWRMHLKPKEWKGDKEISDAFQQRVPRDRRIAMGDRPSPDPESLISGPPQKTPKKGWFVLQRDWYYVLLFIVVAVRLWTILIPNPFHGADTGVAWLFAVALSVGALYFFYWRLYRSRQRR